MVSWPVREIRRRLGRILRRFSKTRSRRNLYPWLEQALKEHAESSACRVVNVGSGGEVEEILNRAGVSATSIDIDAARRPDIIGDVVHMSAFADLSVDVVICVEVLEHVSHPQKAVDEIFRILRPGGVVIGSTPFLLGLHEQPRDYFRYTYHGLRLLFSAFEHLTLRERNGYFASVAALLTRPFVVGSEANRNAFWLASPVLIAIAVTLDLLDRVIPSVNGTTGYFFVFRRPYEVEEVC
jgi:SAM-dependent methyltransferase